MAMVTDVVCGRVDQPRIAGFKDRPQRFAVSRECIAARNRGSRVDLSVNQAGILQFSWAIGHYAIGKARDSTFEFAEASWPLQQEKQKLERPPLGQHLQLPCEVFRQLKRGLVLTAFLASHSTAGHQRSGMAKFSLCTMPLCTPREDV